MHLISVLTLLAGFTAANAATPPKDHPALPAKQVEVLLPAKPPEPAPSAAAPTAAAAPRAEQPETKSASETAVPDEEGGRVMVDSIDGRLERAADSFESARGEEPAQSGIPSSYGQFKGTLSEGGRSFLVFENEEGVISLVQAVLGKESASWKLAAQFPRSAD